MIRVRKMETADIEACVGILRALPQWFGIESAIVEYGRDLADLDGFVALDDKDLVGFVGLKRYGEESLEINVIGVVPGYRGTGVGTLLLNRVQTELDDAVRLLHMKTLAPSHPDPNYEETRAFWKAKGFVAMDAHGLWGDENPCLVMVKPVI
jgi:GNAT superfamily N-acetyltransferase